MFDAFLSYAREDLSLVEQLQQALTQAGKEVWRDLSGIAGGEVFWSRIEDAIAESHYFLFIMSDHSLCSANCRKEVDFAVQNQKRILPVDFRPVRTTPVWDLIADVQWIYGLDRFDAAVSDLVQALNGIPQYRRLHTRWLERAREWDANKRDSGLLLRGSELATAEEWLEDSAGRSPSPSDLQIDFIRVSRAGENSTRDGILARRLANQAEVLFSEGAGMLERSLLVAVESVQRLPIMTAHRVLSQGLDRLPTQLPLLDLPKVYAVCGDPPVLATVNPGSRLILLTDLAGKNPEQSIDPGFDKVTELEFFRSSSLLLVWRLQESLTIIDVLTGKVKTQVDSPTTFLAQVSHDHARLMLLDQSGRLRIINLETRTVLLDKKKNEWRSASKIAFHRQLFAIYKPENQVTVWSLPDLKQIVPIASAELERLEFSPDGSRLLTVPTKGGEPQLWDTQSGKMISDFDVSGWGVGQIAFRPGSGHLATASLDRTARLWDANGINIAMLEHETEVFGVTWTNDGAYWATAEKNGATQLWDSLSRNFGSTTADDEYRTVLAVNVLPQSRLLVTEANDKLERWAFGLASGPVALLDQRNPLLTNIAFSNDGRYLAAVYEYHRLVVHDLQTGEQIGTFESPQDQAVHHVSASPDSHYFLLHSEATFLVELPSFRVTPLHVMNIWEEIAWSTSGRLIAGQGESRLGTVWSVPNDKELFAGDKIAWGLAISPDEQLVAMVGQYAPLRVSQLADGSTREFVGHKGSTYSCDFSGDGTVVASAGEDGTARVWEVASGKELMVLHHAGGTVVRCVVFSPDRKLLASCGDDRTVRIWNFETGEEVFHGVHSGKVNFARFDLSGRYLASGGDDQTARVWNHFSGEEIARFRHEEFVFDAHFSPDGNYLSTLSAYGSRRVGRVWLWNPSELTRQVKSRLTRALTDEEKRYYLGVS